MASLAQRAEGAGEAPAGPSSPTWPSLKPTGQAKRAWGDMSDDGSSRSSRGRAPQFPGVNTGRGRGFGGRAQTTQGHGYAQQSQPRPAAGTGKYGDLPWRPVAQRAQLMRDGRCLRCEQLGHMVANCPNPAYNSQAQQRQGPTGS